MDGELAAAKERPPKPARDLASVRRLEELEAENALLRQRLEAANEEVARWQRRAAAAQAGRGAPPGAKGDGSWDVV